MATVWLSKHAEDDLKRLNPTDLQVVTKAISVLEDDDYRGENKIDFCVIENDYRVWGLLVGYVWLTFGEKSDKEIEIVHLSIQSRFRRRENKE